jgi:transcriptional regulator with XRE-family HTH domain
MESSYAVVLKWRPFEYLSSARSLLYTDVIMELHLQVKEARKQAGLTQEELARRASVGRTDVSRFEQGENVTMKTFLRIVGALPELRDLTISDNLHVRKEPPSAPLSPEGLLAMTETDVMNRLAAAFLQNLAGQTAQQQQPAQPSPAPAGGTVTASGTNPGELSLLRTLGQLIVEMAIRGKVF